MEVTIDSYIKDNDVYDIGDEDPKQIQSHEAENQSSPKSILEETFRSIDMKKVLTVKKVKKPSKQTRDSSSMNDDCDNDNIKEGYDHDDTIKDSPTIDNSKSSPKIRNKDMQLNTSVMSDAADEMLHDAFETMADIAVELFNNESDDKLNNNSILSNSILETSTSILNNTTNILSADFILQNMSTNDVDKHNNISATTDKRSNNGTTRNVNDTSVDIPFDERGLSSSRTPVGSNRKSLNDGSAIGRLRYDRDIQTRHNNRKSATDSNSNTYKDNRSAQEIYQQKQKTWEKRKLEAEHNKRSGKNGNNKKMDGKAGIPYLNDVGSFMELVTKPITDVVQQSQAFLYETFNFNPYGDDDYSSGSSSYDSDSDDDNDVEDDESRKDDFSLSSASEDEDIPQIKNKGVRGGSSHNANKKKHCQHHSKNKDTKPQLKKKVVLDEPEDVEKSNPNNTKSSVHLKQFLKVMLTFSFSSCLAHHLTLTTFSQYLLSIFINVPK